MEDTPKATTRSYTRNEIFGFVKNVWHKRTEKQVAAVETRLSEDEGSPFEITPEDKKRLGLLLAKLSTRWIQAERKSDRFQTKNKNWLKGVITFVNGVGSSQETGKKAQKKKSTQERSSFDNVTDRTKRRRTEELRSSTSTSELVYAAQMSLRASGAPAASTVVKAVTSSSPGRAAKYQKAFKEAQKPALAEISADVALNVIISGKMTKQTYLMLRSVTNNNRRASVYPSYNKVLAAKQRCYPPKSSIKVSETMAEVELLALLDHISARLVNLTRSAINAVSNGHPDKCILICKWGCDGSSGKMYKQKFSDESSSDANVFFTSIVPLQLAAVSQNMEQVLWRNPKPSSTRFCRPLRLQFVKESPENIRAEKQYFDDQINSLAPFHTVVDNKNIMVKYQLVFTMIDGKVKNAVTDTSSAQRCYICKATTKQFNSIDALVNMKSDEASLTLGVSSLHAWIRFMKWFIHLAYKNSDDNTEKNLMCPAHNLPPNTTLMAGCTNVN